MSERNQDVVRALAAFGSDPLVYHSFGPFIVRPRVTYAPPEPLAAPAERLATRPPAPEPRYFDDPHDEPVLAPLPKPVAQPPVNPPSFNPPAYNPPAHNPPAMSAPEPVPVPQPMPTPMPTQAPAPLYPLLAAALPEVAQPAAPQQSQAPNLQPGAAWQEVLQPMTSPRYAPPPAGYDPPQPQPTPSPMRGREMNFSRAGATAPFQPAARGTVPGGLSGALPGTELPGDRRSLSDMFRVLSGGPEAKEPPAPPAEPPPVPDAQALFRRI